MIFVSYSHKNPEWLERWQMMSAPTAIANGMEFWSDQKLESGKWEPQLNAAMSKSEAVLLLVSPAFLASDFIMSKELPYFLAANEQEGKEIFWLLLEPCVMRHMKAKKIKEFQGITLDGNIRPLADMKTADWQKTMVRGCEMIDDYLRKKEKPVIHPKAKNCELKEITENFELLGKPARRRVEVLVYGGDRWWWQGGIEPGQTKIRVKLGNDKTKSKTKFPVIVITTEILYPQMQKTYLSKPEYRTIVEFTLVRV